MLRLIGFLLAVAVIAAGLAWLADRPGELIVQWQGYEIETSVFRAIVLLVVLLVVLIVARSACGRSCAMPGTAPRPSAASWPSAGRSSASTRCRAA